MSRPKHSDFPSWQRGRFVDGPKYKYVKKRLKDEWCEEEKRTIRGPGIVGTPGCNVIARISGEPDNVEYIMKAVFAYPGLCLENRRLKDRLGRLEKKCGRNFEGQEKT